MLREDPLEKVKATPLQYSGLGVAKSLTQLSNLHFHFHVKEVSPKRPHIV